MLTNKGGLAYDTFELYPGFSESVSLWTPLFALDRALYNMFGVLVKRPAQV